MILDPKNYIEAYACVYVVRKIHQRKFCTWLSLSWGDWSFLVKHLPPNMTIEEIRRARLLTWYWAPNYGAGEELLQAIRKELAKEKIRPIGKKKRAAYRLQDFDRIFQIFERVCAERGLAIDNEFERMAMPPEPVIADDDDLHASDEAFEPTSDEAPESGSGSGSGSESESEYSPSDASSSEEDEDEDEAMIEDDESLASDEY